jgi:TRAP-type uncharacterized transport system substrate-binding protein
MPTRIRPEKQIKRRFHGWGLVALGTFALVFAAFAYVREMRTGRAVQLTASAGDVSGMRYQLLLTLAQEARPHGIELRVVETGGWSEMVDLVDNGTLSFALLPGGFDLSEYKNIRQVAALNVEPLHLLVKEEIFDTVSADLQELRGKTINLGAGLNTGTYWLAREVLAFAGLEGPSQHGPGDYKPTTYTSDELLEKKQRTSLPDAVFVVSTLPSPAVHQLVARHKVRLVPLPFHEAFSLGALSEAAATINLAQQSERAHRATQRESVIVRREHIDDVVIPRYTYQVRPPVPADDIHTLGTRLLMVTNQATAPEVVSRMVDCVFNTHFAKVNHPPLDSKLLQELPEAPWHPGTLAYLDRDKPMVTGDFVSEIANAIQIGAPLLGSLFCLWTWLRQRSRFKREQSFESYIYKVTDIESRAMEIELETRLDLQSLISLQRDLERLKTDALRKFAEGEMEGAELLTSFLAHVNDARNYLTRLILHQRDSLVGQLRIPEDLRGFARGDSISASMTMKPPDKAGHAPGG